MRINKFISHNTNYSRREADELLKAGKVSINGRVVSDLSTEVKDSDKVRIGSRLIKLKKEFSMIVYNKQKGELVTKKTTAVEKLYMIHYLVDFLNSLALEG